MSLQNSPGAARSGLLVTISVGATLLGAAGALAGGLGIREQSASSQGASFAGAAAGGDLSSSFWNSAAIGIAPDGLSTESHYGLILPSTDIRAENITTNAGNGTFIRSTNPGDTITLDRPALVGASYYAWRMNKDLVLGLAVNSPFGLSNETGNPTWSGQNFFRSAKLVTYNANPMASYQVAPGLHLGAGLQIQYASLTFKANPIAGGGASTITQSNQTLDGDDTAFGYTLGALYQPAAGTSIGFGYRSAVRHTLDGAAFTQSGVLTTGTPFGTQPFTPISFNANLTTPDTATLSMRQAVTPSTRLLSTVEWTGWSKVDKISFVATSRGGLTTTPLPTNPGATLSVFDFHWNDGWLFSLGAEWDYSKELTFRTGLGYEISPIRSADQRYVNITDSNRVWLSAGASYRWSQATSFDLGYSHVLFADAAISANTTTPGSAVTPTQHFLGMATSSADIVSVSMKTRW